MKKKNQRVNSSNFLFHNYLTNFYIQIFIISIVCFVTYFQVLSFGLIEFDDKAIIDNSLKTSGISNIENILKYDPYFRVDEKSNFYRPLQNLTILIDGATANGSYGTYHLTNLILHILTSVALCYLLILLGYEKLTSLLLSLIFAVHPLFSFNVSWIAARGDLLVGLFSVLTLIANIKYMQSKRTLFLVLMFLGILAGIFSKETAVLLPFITIFFTIIYGKQSTLQTSENHSKQEKVVFIALSIIPLLIYFIFRMLFMGRMAQSEDISFSPFINNLRYYPVYILKFFVPVELSGMNQFGVQTVIAGIVLIAGLIGLVYFKRDKLNFRLISIYSLWIVLFILPLTFYAQANIQTNEYWEHRAYLPLIGMFLLAAELLRIVKLKQNSVYMLLSLITILFLFISVTQSKSYSNSFDFFDNVIRKGSELPNAYFSRGSAEKVLNDNLNAIADFDKAISLAPDYFEAYFKRGVVKKKIGNVTGAISDLEKAIKLKPAFPDSYYNLSLCYYSKGDIANAINNIQKNINLKPGDSKALQILQSLKRKAGWE